MWRTPRPSARSLFLAVLQDRKKNLGKPRKTGILCVAVRRGGTVRTAPTPNFEALGRRLADPIARPYAVPRLQVTPAHDEAAVLRLVVSGETGWTPRLKRVVYPAWRTTRFVVYRGTGKMLT